MSSNLQKSRIVETPCGPVQGKTFVFEDNYAGSAFLGIPYAQPPVGELRFKKPVPADKWTELKQCTEFAPACPFISPFPNPTLKMDENSLYLNVFTPEALNGQKQPSNLPVLFYIHGGGFLVDCASMVGDEGICKYLCSKGVVVVTFNYRLGFFGFLTLENDQAKGNYGMFDMAMALRWVKDNIASFGGDPDKITVCGQSAGAASADLLTLSPYTRDLFKQAIMFAGTSHCEWAYIDSTLSRRVSIEYAKHLGCEISGQTDEEINKQVFDFFKNCDVGKLTLGIVSNPQFAFYSDLTMPLGPCYDGDFFPKTLKELRKEAPRKIIINGVTEHEGLISAMMKAIQPELTYKQVAERSLRNIRPDLSAELIRESCDHAIGEHEDEKCHEHVVSCIQAISDFMFNNGALEMALSRTRLGDKTYNFMFSYYRSGTAGPLSFVMPFEAATHCMELPYFFGKSILGDFKVEEVDKPIIDRFTTYLTSFMKTGDPNNEKYAAEKWEPIKLDGSNCYFLFGQNEFGMRRDLFDGRTKYWRQFFEQHPRKSHI